jgi:hypothetical protein
MTEMYYFILGIIGTLLTSSIVSLIEFKLSLNKLKNSLSEIESTLDKKIESNNKKSNTIHKMHDEKFEFFRRLLDERYDNTMKHFNSRCDQIVIDASSNRENFSNRVSQEISSIKEGLNKVNYLSYDDSNIKNYIKTLEKKISDLEIEVNNLKNKKPKMSVH